MTMEEAYGGECQRCKKMFIGYKRQIYCSYCGQIVELEKDNKKLKSENEKLKIENEDYKTFLKSLSVTVTKFLK